MANPTYRKDDFIIAVMGSTGTGKSSFIKLLTGDTSVTVGDDLESQTSEVQIVPFTDPRTGRKGIIVDTPGFDDSRGSEGGMTDTEVLKKVTTFLLQKYDDQRKVNGLVYLHPISAPRFSGQMGVNLRMFRELCGPDNFKNVVVLTTFWDKVTVQEGEKREKQLQSNFFKQLVGKARFMRHNYQSQESAQKVLDHIFTLIPTNVKIQEEIRVEGKSLEDTGAGSVHREEIERIIAKHKEEVASLKSEMEAVRYSNKALAQELKEERDKLQAKLAGWERERKELQDGLDEEKAAVEKLVKDAETTKVNQESWQIRQSLKEADWENQLKRQSDKHDKEMKDMQTQLKKANRANLPRPSVQQPPPKSKTFMEMGLAVAGSIPLVPNFLSKPVLGGIGAGADILGSVALGS